MDTQYPPQANNDNPLSLLGMLLSATGAGAASTLPQSNGVNMGAFPVAQSPQRTDLPLDISGMAPSVNPLQRDRQSLLDALMNTPQMAPPPDPVHPALRTPDALTMGLAGLAALLGGRKGREFAGGVTQGWAGAKQNKANQDTQAQNQKYQIDQQNAQMKAQSGVNVAKAQLGFTEDDLQRADQEKIRAENMKFKQEQNSQRVLGDLATKFNGAKSQAEMLRIAKQWREFEKQTGAQVSTAPTDEDAAQAWFEKSGVERDRIHDNWARTLAREVKNEYGMVPPARIAELQAMKKSLESQLKVYGDLNPMLDPIPTEETAVGKHKGKMLELAQQRGVILKDKADQALIESKARVQRLAEKQTFDQDMARQRFGVSAFNANTARMNYELRQENKRVDNAIGKRIDGLKAQIRGKEGLLKNETSTSKRKAIMSDIQEMKGRVQYWREQQGGEVGIGSEPSIGSSEFTTPQGNKYKFGT